jgi:hypothetical protein
MVVTGVDGLPWGPTVSPSSPEAAVVMLDPRRAAATGAAVGRRSAATPTPSPLAPLLPTLSCARAPPHFCGAAAGPRAPAAARARQGPARAAAVAGETAEARTQQEDDMVVRCR